MNSSYFCESTWVVDLIKSSKVYEDKPQKVRGARFSFWLLPVFAGFSPIKQVHFLSDCFKFILIACRYVACNIIIFNAQLKWNDFNMLQFFVCDKQLCISTWILFNLNVLSMKYPILFIDTFYHVSIITSNRSEVRFKSKCNLKYRIITLQISTSNSSAVYIMIYQYNLGKFEMLWAPCPLHTMKIFCCSLFASIFHINPRATR